MNFSKILIANRGEIACRVMRTARALGYRTVAVFSDADEAAPHVLLADEAVRIGASPAAESYLSVDALIAAARRTGADAVHPGYGFLSENAGFAQACADAGLVFIGPPPAAIEAMGDKALAKRRMIAAGVPCAPGYLGDEQGDERLAEEAIKLGFPLLVKAVAGGGGRGMRLVREAGELAQALAGARREAQGAFGDGRLMLERLIADGRHIEIQVFADGHGNAVYLGERDCTAQRRRQKVIEEAPAPGLTEALRQQMGEAAVAAARAVDYVGAGTVEFIVEQVNRHPRRGGDPGHPPSNALDSRLRGNDMERGDDVEMNFFFLEMNTRLQVEHPVTEMVTGYDLVEWQLRVAAGQPLPARQQDIRLSGHAIEARLYTEDPYAGFAPQTGTVRWWQPAAAAARPGVRIDDGIAQGSVISPFYDPMVAKLIVHGTDRDDAIRRLRAALQDAPLLGLRNNGRFLADLVDHPAFRTASMTTTRIDQWLEQGEPLLQRPLPGAEAWCLAAAALAMRHGSGWRADSVAAFDLPLRCDDDARTLRVQPHRSGSVQVTLDGQQHELRVFGFTPGELRYEFDGVRKRVVALCEGDGPGARLHLALQGASHVFDEVSPLPGADAAVDARRARAPVAGVVKQVLVQPGEPVVEGQLLLCVEAMKMEMWLSAGAVATVLLVHAQVGDQVESGAVLVEMELHTSKES